MRSWSSVLIVGMVLISVMLIIPFGGADEETNPPSVFNTNANPSRISNDGAEYAELTVHIFDDTAIDNVTIDLTPIGGNIVHLYCVQNYTQDTTLVNIFNFTTNATCAPGIYNLRVNATDATANGNYNDTETITLTVGILPGEIPVYFVPSEVVVSPGQQFTMNVTVGTAANPAYNVMSDEIWFEYNPAVVHVISVTNGPYLASSGYQTFPMLPTIDNVNGNVKSATETIVNQHVAPNGTGVIWKVTFNATGVGTSYLNFTKVWLAEPPGMPEDLLPVVITNGAIQVSAQGALSGTVTEGDGTTSLAGALVNLTQDSVVIASASTNATGGYLLTSLSVGSYNLTVTKTYSERPSKNCAPNTTAVVIAGGATTVQNMKLRHIADMYWDGKVNMFDLNIFAASWNTCEGDVSYNSIANLYSADTCVNMFDLNVFAAEWNTNYY